MMSDLVARTGRTRQRYEGNLRLVSGCIPYKLVKDNEGDCTSSTETESRLEVLMISSPNRDDLVFPKGGWEDDESVEEAACREALEEAGVRGIIKGDKLGVWEFRSKSSQDVSTVEGGCRGFMFALEVTEELDSWPEKGNRGRKWLPAKEAFKLCRYEWMRGALEVFLRIMTKEGTDKSETIMPTTTSIVQEVVNSVSDTEEGKSAAAVPGEECEIMSNNCHVNNSSNAQHRHHTVTPLTSSFGIMLPGIFL